MIHTSKFDTPSVFIKRRRVLNIARSGAIPPAPQVLALAQRESDAEWAKLRCSALQLLLQLGPDRYGLAVQLLEDSDSSVRTTALRTFAQYGDPKEVRALVARLRGAGTRGVRARAVPLLAVLRDDRELREIACSDRSVEVRCAAVEAYCELAERPQDVLIFVGHQERRMQEASKIAWERHGSCLADCVEVALSDPLPGTAPGLLAGLARYAPAGREGVFARWLLHEHWDFWDPAVRGLMACGSDEAREALSAWSEHVIAKEERGLLEIAQEWLTDRPDSAGPHTAAAGTQAELDAIDTALWLDVGPAELMKRFPDADESRVLRACRAIVADGRVNCQFLGFPAPDEVPPDDT